MALKLGQLAVVVVAQVGQRQIVEQQIQVLLFRELKDKIILAALTVTRFPAASPGAAARLAIDAVILYKVVITGMDPLAFPPRRPVETAAR